MYEFIDKVKVIATKYKYKVLFCIMFFFCFFQYIIFFRFIHRINPKLFITDVQRIMVQCENMIANLHLDKDVIVFASDDTGDYNFNLDNDKNYYVKMSKSGYFLDLVYYDDEFCYESVVEAVNFDKNDIIIDDVYEHSKNDSFNGCNGKKIK